MAENNKAVYFDDFGLSSSVMDGLDAMRFESPSPVQAATIPSILAGKDIIACAQTGTGKTAAFLLPILSELSYGDYPDEHVNVVIMAPTRELAQQIDQQIDAFSYFVGISAVPVYGGTGGMEWEQQKRALRLGADIIVATPGRLISHLNLNTVDLSQVSFFVLDEADRMLDMGFSEDILEIRSKLPDNVQTIMFSATMPEKIRKLAKDIMHDPLEINIAISRPPESIQQEVVFLHDDEKIALLVDLLKEKKPSKAIIFFASKMRVKEAHRMLRSQGISNAEMHSNKTQEERDQIMTDFKNGKLSVIVATDILSRGIDVTDIDLIINFDVPADPEDYIHRIGRTARGTNLSGEALTLVSNRRDAFRFAEIERFLGYEVKRITLPPSYKVPNLQEERKSGNKRLRKKRSGKKHKQSLTTQESKKQRKNTSKSKQSKNSNKEK